MKALLAVLVLNSGFAFAQSSGRQQCLQNALESSKYCQQDCNSSGGSISGCYKACGFAYSKEVRQCETKFPNQR